MKMIKKLPAVALAVVLTLALSISAFAASDTDIKITHAIKDATYNGYRLLETTTSLKVQGCHDTDEEHLSTCYNIAYSVNDKYFEILKTETNTTTETGIIDYIKGLTTADGIREFADDVYAAITAAGKAYDSTATGASDKTATLTGVDQGYWLIVEKISASDYEGAYSLVMLDTAGSRDITVATKREEPGLTKYVRDNGMSYGHGADMQIGDAAEFLLITDVPDPSGYTNYTYLIHDDMSTGLTFNDTSVEIRLNTVDGTVLGTNYYTVTTTGLCADCDVHISINIKAATAAGVLKGDDRLYISYTATLNENAKVLVTGQDTVNANPNTAWLEYSNNPYTESETEESAPSTVYVWTFPLTLNKVDSADVSLTGAKFVLSTNKALTEADLKDDNNDGKPDGYAKLIPLSYSVVEGKKYYKVAPETGSVYEIEVGSAMLQGFDDQVEYYLYETEAPAGYNKLNTPVSFKFFAQYESSESALFAAGYPKVAINAGTEESVLEANVVNQTGVELPSTGGIGTTIFYVVGGLMVLGAVVLLITKKRVGTEK